MAKGISLHLGLNSVDPNYYDGWSGELNACENDASDMQTIADSQGFKSNILLTNEATRNSVKEHIQKAAGSLGNGDIFFISYSGHGGRIPDASGDEFDDLMDETWCLYDGEILDDELELLWKNFQAGVKILITSDSCHSGTVAKFHKDSSQPGGTPKNKVKQMPDKVALRTYLANKSFYNGIFSEINKGFAKMKNTPDGYTGLLISGCLDHEFSYDGPFNGAFTAQLKVVWNNGNFTGNYEDFHHEIWKRLSKQTPNYFRFGAPDMSYDKLKPFAI